MPCPPGARQVGPSPVPRLVESWLFGHSKNTDWELHWSILVTPGTLTRSDLGDTRGLHRGPACRSPAASPPPGHMGRHLRMPWTVSRACSTLVGAVGFNDGNGSVLLTDQLDSICFVHADTTISSRSIQRRPRCKTHPPESRWHSSRRLSSGHQPARSLLSVLHLTLQAELGLTQSPVRAPPGPTATCRHAHLLQPSEKTPL